MGLIQQDPTDSDWACDAVDCTETGTGVGMAWPQGWGSAAESVYTEDGSGAAGSGQVVLCTTHFAPIKATVDAVAAARNAN